jgi:hypothetical protein
MNLFDLPALLLMELRFISSALNQRIVSKISAEWLKCTAQAVQPYTYDPTIVSETICLLGSDSFSNGIKRESDGRGTDTGFPATEQYWLESIRLITSLSLEKPRETTPSISQQHLSATWNIGHETKGWKG